MKTTYLNLLAGALAVVAVVSCNNPSQHRDETQAKLTTKADDKEQISASTESQPDTIKKSIPSETNGKIGKANVQINYHSPGVKDRTIWGGLVAFDQVWVTGAHKATAVKFDKAVKIDGKEVAAGTYALFTIPGREEWTIILNKDYEQHLADDYDQKKDVLRVKVKPKTLDQHQERLKYEIHATTTEEGAITISWEKVQVSLPVSTNFY
ncbi:MULTISPECIES: DUF2911 domain-containing protein [Hymenobacter]|uniref:DUF2911 domain-containing protein n=1 Tax=Hymenobacter TaxID=89966 RepID=UPI0010588518|nr:MULTISPECIES: DUF2911 domain-containing protein [Hymenobacter]QIL78176.1 DUF2911 domain-containing protein [Hymenobacter sp. HDW8]